jgi:hypothetical protein
MKSMKSKINIGDTVELLREELLDDNYHDYLKTKVTIGTQMIVVAIAPKVRMVKGEGNDNNPYFLNLELPGSDKHSRVRTNFCNVKFQSTPIKTT